MSGESYPRSAAHGQPGSSASSSNTIRLPRLDALDNSSADGPLPSHMGRNRSISSASYHSRPPYTSQMEVSTSWSPRVESWSDRPIGDRQRPPPLFSTSASTPSEEAWRADPRSIAPSHAVPQLPRPQRRSTMMSGALPPLAALQHSGPPERGYVPTMHSPKMETHIAGLTMGSPSGSRAPPPLNWASAGAASSSADHRPMDGRDHHLLARTMSFPPPIAPPDENDIAASNRKGAKAHVSSACLNCKRAHLACDAERPCRRCSKLGKTATCVDVQHKKRGRPRLKEREAAASGGATKTSPNLASSGSTDSGWSPSADATGHYHSGGLTTTDWSPSPEAQDMRTTLSLATSGRSRTFSAASAEMIALDSAPLRQTAMVTTILCGTDLVTAHVSQESQYLCGLLPSQLCHRSLLDIVAPDDTGRLHNAWSRLLSPVGLAPAPFPAAGLEMMRRTSCKLLRPARGTIFIEETLRIRTGERHSIPCSVRLHLGGAFGLDLYRPESKQHAFVVCSIVPLDGRMSEMAASSLHPSSTRISMTEYPALSQGEAVFRSPVGSPPQAAMDALSLQSHWTPRSSQRGSVREEVMVQSPPMMSGWSHETSPRRKKRSSDGVLLYRPAKSPSLSPPPISRGPPALAAALNVSTGSHKAVRPIIPSSLTRTHSVLPSSSERYHEAGRFDGDGSGHVANGTSSSPGRPRQAPPPQLQYGVHRPFSSAILPFSTQRPSTMRPPACRSAATQELHSVPLHRTDYDTLSDSRQHDSADRHHGHGYTDDSSSRASITMDRSASTAGSTPLMLRRKGDSEARLANLVPSARSSESGAEGLGTVAC
ncbi:hypothetical protein BCV69DRAFT_180995 [Microstroma glucosiphilum]|uniref:Transcription activator of gluconeogenesis ERT1 n=1 Tax=Pseudomicrostroma glucosiphilum TaxID=1684307 RepID=A0A316U6W0_9BASI|nr:hypothetical protein BCV69DRAFT_180995 [Pseudomicrostroma glucosiphilum]PWN20996.1 hypothetical protein BCV69DRAFT_180995 [Pseudomicrostroma glucosiphilum]